MFFRDSSALEFFAEAGVAAKNILKEEDSLPLDIIEALKDVIIKADQAFGSKQP